MKTLFIFIVGIVVGLFLWAKMWINFTQDLSIEAVENVLNESMTAMQSSGSDSQTRKFNEIMMQKLEKQKTELSEKLKWQLSEFLKQKVDSVLWRNTTWQNLSNLQSSGVLWDEKY